MVLTDERVKDGGKVLVGVPVSGVDTAVLVVELNGASDGLDEGESGSLGLDSLELLPLVLGDELGNQRVLGLDGGEGSVSLSGHWLVFAGVASSEGLILLPEGVDAINHLLDELHLGVSEPVLVGDVIGVSSLATGFSTGSTGLQVKLLATSLELGNAVLGPARQVNVDRGPHAGTKVGGAGVDVAVLLIKTEVLASLSLNGVLDGLDTLGQSAEHFPDISSLLHGDDAELILLVDPDEEGLLCVVEDATTLRPVTLHTSNGQVPVSGDEEEVVVNELLADLLVHASQRVVVSGKVRGEALDCVCHQLLNSDTLVLGDSGGKAKAIDGTTNTDSARVDRDIRVDIALNLADIHVRGVPCRGADSVVLLDQRVKDGSEVLVRVPVTGVDAAVLVVELDCASNGLGKSEPRGLSGDVLQLVPLLLGDVLGNKRVLGGNEGEVTKVGLLVLLVLLPQGVDAINHLLDELNLGVSKPVLVGDVIGEASLAARLSTGSTGLQVKLLATSLELLNAVLGPARQVNVDRGPHASTKVGGAGVDVTEPLIEAEVLARLLLDRVLDSLDTLGEPLKDLLHIASHLHGDDTELILLIDPDEESLLVVVEDATTLRPVTFHAGNGQVPVSGDEEEVVVNQLLADLLVHASQRVVFSGKVRGEALHCVLHQVLNSDTLVLGDSGRQAESIDGTANTDSARVDRDILIDVALNLADIHVRGVLGRWADSVVLTDERVKDGGEVLVGVPVSGVDTAVLVVELNGASDGLDEGE